MLLDHLFLSFYFHSFQTHISYHIIPVQVYMYQILVHTNSCQYTTTVIIDLMVGQRRQITVLDFEFISCMKISTVRLAQVLKTFFINVPYHILVACLTLMALDENFLKTTASLSVACDFGIYINTTSTFI